MDQEKFTLVLDKPLAEFTRMLAAELGISRGELVRRELEALYHNYHASKALAEAVQTPAASEMQGFAR
jgi:hypothetical protein